MSETDLFQPAWCFLGLEEELADPARARAWVLPVPYEATTTYGAGTRFGPEAIIAASRQVELFDREFGGEPASGWGVHTLSPLGIVHRSPEAMVAAVEEAVAGIVSGSPAPEVLAILGGEHSLSVGAVRAVARARGDVVAVQVDAHADLRDEYEGTPYSHACAARRIAEICPIFQVGVRSISAGGEAFRRESPRVETVFAEEANEDPPRFLDRLAAFVRARPVYLTIDLDGLDPSIMPATGTPEPGGMSWRRVLEVVRTACREASCLPAFDVVELAPIPGLVGPDYLAAKLVYKVMALALARAQA